jgi:phosphatidylglycerophosphate synthase
MSESITKAVLLALKTTPAGAAYDAVYGGETLLNRALIALSKSGVRCVKIICVEDQRKKIELMLGAVRERIALEYEVLERPTAALLSDTIFQAVEKWDECFLLFEADKIVHPTLFAQAVQFTASRKPILFVYKDIWVQDGRAVFAPSFPEKFRVIFRDVRAFTKIFMERSVFQQGLVDLATFSAVEIGSEAPTGVVSTEIAVCSRFEMQEIACSSFAAMVQQWKKSKALTIGFVERAWWLKVTGTERAEQVREFFWKIAFKEISGEFSKLVNSKLSKPLTFLFVRLGFSPNTISILELLLFFVSSAFLLFEPYWAMLVFAVIWQFAAGVLDRCDGEVARVRNYESESGARFDMLIDDLRFGIPFVFLTIACYWEFHQDFYLLVAATTFVWYVTAVIFHNRFLRRAGYVSIQAMGVDFLKTQEGTGWLKVFRKFQPLTKGDIRTFYIFLLAFLGRKNVLFWMLVAYAWPLGGSYFFTIWKFRLPSPVLPVNR